MHVIKVKYIFLFFVFQVVLLLCFLFPIPQEYFLFWILCYIFFSIFSTKFLKKEFQREVRKNIQHKIVKNGFIIINKAQFYDGYTIGYVDPFKNQVKIKVKEQKKEDKIFVENILFIEGLEGRITMKKVIFRIAVLGFFISAILLAAAGIFNFYYGRMLFEEPETYEITDAEKQEYMQNQTEEDLIDSEEDKIKEAENQILENIREQREPIPFHEDIFNILLIGTDDRENVEGSRSDAMILCSFNKKTKQVSLTSFMRDSYVQIPNHGNNRLNAAYAFGGTKLLIDTIQENFKIEIDRYAKVNFFDFIDIIDAFGGIDMELSKDEIRVINLYLGEINYIMDEKEGTDYIDGDPGLYHLNGKQALAYSRNRYTGNSDFSRTERQRNVILAAKDSIKNLNLIELNSLLLKLLPSITTDMTKGECLSLLIDSPSYLKNDIKSYRIPCDGSWSDVTINKMRVLSIDFKENIKYLKENLYDLDKEETSDGV